MAFKKPHTTSGFWSGMSWAKNLSSHADKKKMMNKMKISHSYIFQKIEVLVQTTAPSIRDRRVNVERITAAQKVKF